MKPFLVDVPVLILFFNRPQQLSQVFEQVRNARPSKLFLYQDGPDVYKRQAILIIEKIRNKTAKAA